MHNKRPPRYSSIPHHSPSNPINPNHHHQTHQTHHTPNQKHKRTRQQKHRKIPLLLQLRTPIPRARQPPVDTAPRIEKVVRPGPVEPVPKEIAQDVAYAVVGRAEFVLDVGEQRGLVRETGYLGEGVADGEEDAVDLGILV